MDTVVIASIAAIVGAVVTLVGFIWYWVRKIIHHPTSSSQT